MAVGLAAGPHLLTAQERAEAEGEDLPLSVLSRLYHPDPAFLDRIEL